MVIRLFRRIPTNIAYVLTYEALSLIVLYYSSTNKVSKGPNPLLLMVAKKYIDYQHQSHHAIEVSYCHVWAEHPGVVK